MRSTIHLLGVAFHFLPAGGGSKLSPISEMGFPGQAGGYFAPYNNDFEDAPKGEYLTERLTSEAIGFLQDHAKNQSEKPFIIQRIEIGKKLIEVFLGYRIEFVIVALGASHG